MNKAFISPCIKTADHQLAFVFPVEYLSSAECPSGLSQSLSLNSHLAVLMVHRWSPLLVSENSPAH